MKRIYILFLIFTVSINAQKLKFGDDIANEKITINSKIETLYKSKEKFNTSFKAKVKDVCQMKGCWIKLDIGNNNEVMVSFKDYAFFVPKDIKGKDVMVSGEAYTRTIPIKELKHYARDRGDSETIIESIKKPKEVYSLTAKGVILYD
jgi:hypothetical protein